jgi:hypothetical protein
LITFGGTPQGQTNQKGPDQTRSTYKLSVIGPGMGFSSFNKSMNNFSTVHAISAQMSSIGAALAERKLAI